MDLSISSAPSPLTRRLTWWCFFLSAPWDADWYLQSEVLTNSRLLTWALFHVLQDIVPENSRCARKDQQMAKTIVCRMQKVRRPWSQSQFGHSPKASQPQSPTVGGLRLRFSGFRPVRRAPRKASNVCALERVREGAKRHSPNAHSDQRASSSGAT